MVDNSVVISLTSGLVFVIAGSITFPLLLVRHNDKMQAIARKEEAEQRHEEKLEDWARQDAVAERAEEARKELLKTQEETAEKAAEAARAIQANQREAITQAAEAAASQDVQLKQLDLQTKRIHTLVNSDMTAARQDQLDQARATVAILKRVIALAHERGLEPEPQDVEDLQTAQDSIKNLEAILADRLAQMRKVEAEQIAHPIIDAAAAAADDEGD